jgi:hypothetical protein
METPFNKNTVMLQTWSTPEEKVAALSEGFNIIGKYYAIAVCPEMFAGLRRLVEEMLAFN